MAAHITICEESWQELFQLEKFEGNEQEQLKAFCERVERAGGIENLSDEELSEAELWAEKMDTRNEEGTDHEGE